MSEKLERPYRYCLTCGRICLVAQDENLQEFHFSFPTNEEFVNCHGPFTNSTPPQAPVNWIDTVSEPSEDELVVMDENALSLLADFVGDQVQE